MNDLSSADVGKRAIRTFFGVDCLSEGNGGIEHLVKAMAQVVFELIAEDGKVGDRLFFFASVDGRVEFVGKEVAYVVDRGLYGHAVASIAIHPCIGEDLHDGGLTFLVGAIKEVFYGFEAHVFLHAGFVIYYADGAAHFVETVDKAFEVHRSSVGKSERMANFHLRGYVTKGGETAVAFKDFTYIFSDHLAGQVTLSVQGVRLGSMEKEFGECTPDFFGESLFVGRESQQIGRYLRSAVGTVRFFHNLMQDISEHTIIDVLHYFFFLLEFFDRREVEFQRAV